jgi:hypothetical protein
MSAIELRRTFLGHATRQRGPSRRCPDRSSGALVLRDCSDRRVHRPQHVVGLSAKRTRHALWHLLRAAVGARNRKCLPAFRAGDDFLHRYLSTWPRDKCFDIPSRLRPAFPRIRFSLFQEGHKHLITSQGMMLAVCEAFVRVRRSKIRRLDRRRCRRYGLALQLGRKVFSLYASARCVPAPFDNLSVSIKSGCAEFVDDGLDRSVQATSFTARDWGANQTCSSEASA